MKVLVADDDRAIRQSLTTALELNGYQAGVLVDRLIDPYRDDDDFNEVVDD